MKKNYSFFTFLILSYSLSSQEVSYKEMMQDNSYNFYEVVDAAEAYFSSMDKDAKGSGYKPFMRWVNANEYKYYPDGNRSNVDPYFVAKQYQSFLKNNGIAKNLYNGSWKELGPNTIDSITGHYSAGLGRIEDFYVNPNDSNRIYIGSRSGGFWRSTDGGANWQGTTDFLFASGVNAISASPTNADSVLINVRNADNGTSHGVYRSTNGGLNWIITPFNPTNLSTGGLGTNFQINEIAYHPTIGNLIFVATNTGIYKSTDNLQTFSRAFPSQNIIEITFHPTNDSIMYIYNATASGNNRDRILVSRDLGTTYLASGLISGNNANTRVELSTSPICSSCVYFASNNGVWISTNEGQTFSFRSNSTQANGGFAVSDIDTNYMAYGYVDLDNSSDGGRTFVQRTEWYLGSTNGNTSTFSSSYATSTDYIHADVRNLKCINGVFYAATDGFLCKSNDNGLNWSILTEGTGIRENYKLGLSQSNHYRSMIGSQDNGTSIYTEKGWVEFYGADGMEAIIHPLNENWMVGSVQYGIRRLTKNGGQSSSGANPTGSSNAYWEAPIAFDPNNQMNVYDFRDLVYKSNDFMETTTALGNPGSIGGDIRQAAIAENNSNIMVVAAGSSIEKSTNGGLNFSNIKSNLLNHAIQDIAFDPRNDDVIIVVYAHYQNDSQKVYLTTNGGSTWTNITYNLGSMPIRSVAIDHTDSTNIYLGAEIGVYTKTMNSTSWSLYNTALPNMAVRDLEINYGSNTLRAATWGRGMWEFNLVGRADYPALMYTTITDVPTEAQPKAGIDQYVTTKVHYNGTLSAVYLEYSPDSAVFGNRINMTNTVDSTWIANLPIPQYAVGRKVFFKVFAVGANNDTTESYKFMYEVKPFQYCDARGNTSSGNLFINRVQLRNLNNTSVNNGYTNYTTPVVELFVDSSYTLTINANTNWTNNDYGAWIDFNKDTDLDSGENVLFSPNSSGVASNTFTVPSNASVGDTVKMRVRLSYWNDATPCGDYFGEVEDYLVVIRSITTDIEIATKTKVASIFPNPNNGSFTLQFEEARVNVPIQLFDMQGKMIEERIQNGEKQMSFNLNLKKGTYYLRIGSGREVETLNLIIGD